MSRNSKNPRIVIIGAGVAGLTVAHVLSRHGFTDYRIVEKGTDVGGVWHWNRYPGLTCDVPSQLYQFGFASNPNWKRIWATGAEIAEYCRDVSDSLGITDRIRFGTEIVSADWNDTTDEWALVTAQGETIVTDFMVCATGVLHNPAIPDIPGLEDFAGQVVHTARWEDDVTVDDSRIGVIGSGSTGVQVVSALQPASRSITHFVRSPQWVVWAPMEMRQPRVLSSLLARAPGLHRRLYDVLLWASGILADITTTPSWRRTLVQSYVRLSLKAQIRGNAELRPDYQPLCKRQVVSGSYFRALRRPNANVVTQPIERITRSGIRTSDGTHHEVDLLVLATGFRAHDYMRPMKITGRGGRTLDEVWATGPRAYRMTAVPGMPNLFTVLGPNSPTGSISLQYAAEITAEYIASWLMRYRRGDLSTVEVTDAATDEFYRDVTRAMQPTVWNTGCNSWYKTESGTVDLWPFDRATLTDMLSEPYDDHFHLT